MVKVVQLSERKSDGKLDPFYPVTHAEGMVGLDEYLNRTPIQLFPITKSDGTIQRVTLTDWDNIFEEVTEYNQVNLAAKDLPNAPNTTDTYWNISLIREYKTNGVVHATSLFDGRSYTRSKTSGVNGKWSEWLQISTGKRTYLESEQYDIHTLPAGFYETTRIKNSPLGDDEASFKEIDIYESYGGRKQIYVTFNYLKERYFKTFHTDSTDRGWVKLLDEETYKADTQTKTIWTGGYHMVAAHTVTPSIPLDQCKEWILYWSKYSGGAAQAYYWCTQIVTKETLGGHNFDAMMDGSPVHKYVYISNSQIKGTDDNNAGTNGQAVLRKVVALL